MKVTCLNFSTNEDQSGWPPKQVQILRMHDFVSSGNSNGPFFAKGDESQKVVFGENSCDSELGKQAKALGSHAFVVTDSGLSVAGHPERICKILKDSGLKVTLYDRSIQNPTDSSAQTCAEAARRAGIDLIIGLGGGSSMDTAKGCNFLLTNGGRMADYWGIDKASKSMLPMVAIPTTAGTGSECQSFALISEDDTHRKMACGDKKALPRLTILDPVLTLSQPAKVTACTGIDALAHALESAVTTKRNSKSYRHSQIAFQLIQKNLPKIFDQPNDLVARGMVLLGASHAGAAIERSMLGAAHSMANPLTAREGLVHGVAVGLALPVVMEFNSVDSKTRSIYAELSRLAGLGDNSSNDQEAADSLILNVRSLLQLAGISQFLNDFMISASGIEYFAKEASEQWTAGFNPRSLKISDFEKLYSKLYSRETCEISNPMGN